MELEGRAKRACGGRVGERLRITSRRGVRCWQHRRERYVGRLAGPTMAGGLDAHLCAHAQERGFGGRDESQRLVRVEV